MSTYRKQQRDHLDYPHRTMFEMISSVADSHPHETAYEFYGKKTDYKEFVRKTEQAARAFKAAGIREGDAVTICMPNMPQALVCFYALNRIHAIANMVHPLSAIEEITFYLNLSGSKMLVTADLFYENVIAARRAADHPVRIIITRMQEELPLPLSVAYTARKGRSLLKYPNEDNALTWKKFLKNGTDDIALPKPRFEEKRTAVILYSGGTTGTPKGICLTDLNFNALALQAAEAIGVQIHPGHRMLSCMPMFHGFGLGINIHTILVHGATCILMPTFSNKTYAGMLRKKQPHFIAGVPTIFEALLHLKELDGVDLSCLKGMFCGGDSLSVGLKKKIDTFLSEHNAQIQVREGYGLTECVTASCLTPKDDYREGSIGIPFPDTVYAIVKPGTEELLPPGTEGEIILRGPTLMTGYLHNPEETREALRVLPDGFTWLYTGDLGKMDEDGFVYFIQRAKRMIITNGYNVYPGQIENFLDEMEEISMSCVIGVPDPHRMQRVRAYVVLREGYTADEKMKNEIMNRLRLKVAKYALPREMIFRGDLPRTLVGKVDYRKLEEQAEGASDEP